MPRGSRCVLHDCDLEAPLEQFAHVGFDTEIRRHSRQDDLADVALAELQHQIVVLGAIDLVWAGHDGLAVLDEWFVPLEPVGTRPGEAVEVQRAWAIKHLDLVHNLLESSFELPPVIGGVVVVGRDEDLESILLRGLEEPFDVLDGLVFLNAVANQLPGDALLTEEVILRVGDYYCGTILVDIDDSSPLS